MSNILKSRRDRGVEPSLFQSLIPIVVLLFLIMVNVLIENDDMLGGANQLSLLFAASIAVCFTIYNGVSWNKILKEIVDAFPAAIPAIIILLLIGVLSGSWMVSGIIPTMIYYGLDILRPEYFLPATVIITSAISLATGSSWSTIATIGVALIGIGDALGFSSAWTAGAIISGAYFGDKASPLSDTTNLASTVAGVDVFKHIRFMMHTTVPSLVLTLVAFGLLTFFGSSNSADMSRVAVYQQVIGETYNLSLWFMLIPAIVVFLIVKKMPAIPVLFIGALLAIVAAVLFQQQFLVSLNGGEALTSSSIYSLLTNAMYGRTAPQTGVEAMDNLLSTGGMLGMMNTVWLIITAMVFGGAMEAGGFLSRIARAILSRVNKRSSIVTATVSTCVLFNFTAGDQYISILIPGRMFSPVYRRKEYNGLLLSRSLEDSATATSVLVPWNTCGATQATILGVATVAYLPFAFFCWISPLMTLLFAWCGWAQGSKSEKALKE